MKIPGSIIISIILLFTNWSDTPSRIFPYQFDAPVSIFQLDDALLEISGLSMSADDRYLVAVQDESGVIYYLDKNNGKIMRQTEFWKEGDYEGIEVVGKDVYVIKSTGTVYRVQNTSSGEPVTEKYNYDLNKDNDVEGLGYDKVHDQLLLACKAHPDGRKDMRGIYSFSVREKRLLQEPAYLLTLGAIHRYLDTEPNIPRLDKVKEFFAGEELDFSPSALAIHPISGALYLLSSKGKMVLVMNRDNEVIHIEKLQKEEHPQPEGLCFDRSGNMYISNEGKDGHATILMYKTVAN